MKKVIVIGAGISGLATARTIFEAGQSVVVLEKNAQIGGRIATQKFNVSQNEILFDCGAQNIKSQNTKLETWSEPALSLKRVFISEPVNLHSNNCVIPGDEKSNAEPKWSCENGMATVPQTLAENLDVRLNQTVLRIEENENLHVVCENGETFEADFVVVSAPAPLAVRLLKNSLWKHEPQIQARIAELQTATYSQCLSVQLWFENWNADFDWYALLAHDRSHPLLWISCENCKGFATRGTALIAQLGSQASRDLWSKTQDEVIGQTQIWLREIFRESMPQPTSASVVRWPHSLPLTTVSFEQVNPHHARVLICGDGTARGRVSAAYESGLKAAARIV